MNTNFCHQESINEWFMRKTTSSSIRRVADLPMVIASDVGLVRTENQDRAAVFRFQKGDAHDATIIAIVCDGMGGMADGAICSSLAISSFLSGYMQGVDLHLNDRIVKAVMQANEAVYARYKGSGGSTLSALIIDDLENAFVVNVGDSRVYSLTGHELLQITVDDTIAGQLGHVHGQNGLLQYIGIGQGIEPHLIPLSEGLMSSSIFLTSDGVHFLDKRVMESVIRHAPDSAYAVKRLIELSKWCGGYDNASAIVINLSALEKINFNSSSLEIWDAFTELRIVDAPKATLKIQKAEDRRKPSVEASLGAEGKPATQKRSRVVRDPKKKTIKKDITAHVKATPSPELQVDFESK